MWTSETDSECCNLVCYPRTAVNGKMDSYEFTSEVTLGLAQISLNRPVVSLRDTQGYEHLVINGPTIGIISKKPPS